VRTLSTLGEPFGGGDDIDWALTEAVLSNLKSELGEFEPNASITEMLRQTCETAKRGLGRVSEVSAVIPFLPIGTGIVNHEVLLDEQAVDAILRDPAARVASACMRALQAACIPKTALAAVYATGGSWQLPHVRVAIEGELGVIASRRLDPDGSVALGAAYRAGALLGMVKNIHVIDEPTTTPLQLFRL